MHFFFVLFFSPHPHLHFVLTDYLLPCPADPAHHQSRFFSQLPIACQRPGHGRATIEPNVVGAWPQRGSSSNGVDSWRCYSHTSFN